MSTSKELSNFNLVIFGGDGDLALKKLFPALYFRLKDGQIRKKSTIFVVSKNEKTQDSFIQQLKEHIHKHVSKVKDDVLNDLCDMTSYLKIELTSLDNYEDLKIALDNTKVHNTIFYYQRHPFCLAPFHII